MSKPKWNRVLDCANRLKNLLNYSNRCIVLQRDKEKMKWLFGYEIELNCIIALVAKLKLYLFTIKHFVLNHIKYYK